MTQQIFIGNFPLELENNELQRHFEAFGEMTQIIIIRERDTQHSRGFGFITFVTAAAAQKAIEVMNGSLMGGRQLRVTLARPRMKKSRSNLPAEAVLTTQEPESFFDRF